MIPQHEIEEVLSRVDMAEVGWRCCLVPKGKGRHVLHGGYPIPCE